jgi:hypothetical protein
MLGRSRGRPKGPEKKRMRASVLPATAQIWEKLALHQESLGAVLDEIFAQKKYRKFVDTAS